MDDDADWEDWEDWDASPLDVFWDENSDWDDALVPDDEEYDQDTKSEEEDQDTEGEEDNQTVPEWSPSSPSPDLVPSRRPLETGVRSIQRVPMDLPLMDLSLMELSLMQLSLMQLSLMDLPLMELSLMDLSLMQLSLMELSLMELSLMELSLMQLSLMELFLMELSLMDLFLMQQSLSIGASVKHHSPATCSPQNTDPHVIYCCERDLWMLLSTSEEKRNESCPTQRADSSHVRRPSEGLGPTNCTLFRRIARLRSKDGKASASVFGPVKWTSVPLEPTEVEVTTQENKSADQSGRSMGLLW
uniref:Uncharacterized protein n=1 Tax=Knipowitschia caucasica TaxID=637954 RepID=A0AAV2M0H5_KNICA